MKFFYNIKCINWRERINELIRREFANYSKDSLLKYNREITSRLGKIIILSIMFASTIIYKCFYAQEYKEIAVAGIIAVHLSYLCIKFLDKIPDKFRKLIKFGFFLLMAVPFICEVFLVSHYDKLIKTGVIMVLLETNLAETKEFLQANIGVSDIVTLAATLITVLLVRKPWLRVKEKCVLSDKVKVNVMRIYLVSVVAAFTAFRLCCWDSLMTGVWLYPQLRVAGFTAEAFDNMRGYDKIINEMNTDVKITSCKDDVSNIVLIVGESTNRNYMELYGHKLPTTPYLSELAGKNELAVFRDCISPYSATILVLRELFTFHNAEAEGEWYKYNNMIDIMKSAGYHTAWLSNQESSGVWGNVARALASRCNYAEFTRQRDSRDSAGNDSELFPLISETIEQRSSDKNFYVIHLMGCHQLYNLRYNKDFAHFKAEDIDRDLSKDKKDTVAEYENAVLFNDYVVNHIIEEFNVLDNDTVVIYISDHGENVYDTDDNIGHIADADDDCLFQVPFVIWCSSKFKAKHPEKWHAICNATSNPYMSDDMIHTVMDIAGIETTDYDETRSVINKSFNTERIRIRNSSFHKSSK